MKLWTLLAALLITLSAARADVPDTRIEQARSLLENAQRELITNAAAIDQRSGLTQELTARLATDMAQLSRSSDPEATLVLAQLDAGLVDQLATQTYVTLSAVRGPSAALLPAVGAKKRAYVLAMYVPETVVPRPTTPIIIYLHGKGQNEADAIASPLVRSWANDGGAVVIAPYMRDDDMLSDATITTLFAALGAIEDAMQADRRHTYLAGNSLGGFAAFRALAANPDRWRAGLVIEGAVAQTDSDSVAAHVRGKSLYIVAGSNDASINSAYMRQLASWLRSNGAVVTYYEQPDGTHSLSSVAPMAGRAWHDMLAGITPTGGGNEVMPQGPTPPPKRP
jgi:predicted esterase